MTVLPQCCFTTNDLVVKPAEARFYGLDIPVPHPQLRSFFSTVDKDWIYFASRSDLYALHLPSQRKLLVKTLSVEPRCLAAGLGWICAGGEQNGEVAFVRLIDEEHDSRFQPGAVTDGFPESGLLRLLEGEKSLQDLVHKSFGGEIVNSITVHELSNVGRSLWNEPVALLSNNDKTVKIYSLIQQRLIADLVHPSPMNCALISPDSELLVAVGDSDQAYVYRRRSIHAKSPFEERFATYEWEVVTHLRLPCGEKTYDDHSFSVAFSPSGHLCAISAQGGMISIFDMSHVAQSSEESETYGGPGMLCAFKSFRSGLCGSVRSMSFSPRPWDLLVWAEDRGRAGVVDVRQAFCRRQMIELDPHSSSLDRVKLTGVTDPSIKSLDSRGRQPFQYQAEYQSARPNAGPSADLRSDPTITPEGPTESILQHLAQTGATDLDWTNQAGLDPTLGVAVAQDDDDVNPRHPYSIDYRAPPPEPRPAPSTEARMASQAQLRSLIDHYREVPTRQAFEFLGDSVLEVRAERPYQPRRRNSVILSQATSLATGLPPISGPRSRITASPVRMTDADTGYVPTGARASEPNAELLGAARPPHISTGLLGPYHGERLSPWHNGPSTLEDSARVSSSLSVSEAASAPNTRHTDELDRPSVDTVPVAQASAAFSTLPAHLNSDTSQSVPYSPVTRGLSRREPHPSELETERQLQDMRSDVPELERNQIRRTAMSQAEQENALRLLNEQSRRQLRMVRQEQDRFSSQTRSLARTPVGQRAVLTAGATHAELRLAHQMMMRQRVRYGATDRNGNWLGDEALGQGAGRPSHGAGNGLGGWGNTREMGVGTTGVGWSPDGRQFYVGTEEGIFEYKINLMDRMSFPALEFR